MITVYGKPSCVQCNWTTRKLDQYGIEYTKVDVTVDEQALAHVTGLGYQQVPVVEHPDGHWSGYRPDLLAGLARYKEAA